MFVLMYASMVTFREYRNVLSVLTENSVTGTRGRADALYSRRMRCGCFVDHVGLASASCVAAVQQVIGDVSFLLLRTREDKKYGSHSSVVANTWLILPAVICLGRRLSHASVRTASNCESANGSL